MTVSGVVKVETVSIKRCDVTASMIVRTAAMNMIVVGLLDDMLINLIFSLTLFSESLLIPLDIFLNYLLSKQLFYASLTRLSFQSQSPLLQHHNVISINGNVIMATVYRE